MDAKEKYDSKTYVLHVSCSEDLIKNLEEYYINKFTDLYPDLLLNKGTTGVNKKIGTDSNKPRNDIYRVYITFYENMIPAVENGDITISFNSASGHIAHKLKSTINDAFNKTTTFREDNEEWRTTYKTLEKYYNKELQNTTNGNRSVQQIYDAIFEAYPLYKGWATKQLLSTNMINHRLIVAIELHNWDFENKEKLVTEIEKEPTTDYSGVHWTSIPKRVRTDTNNSLITILVEKNHVQRRQAEREAIRARRVRERGIEYKKWQRRYHELIEYKKLYHHTYVPQTFAKNPQLGWWVKAQRQHGKLWSNGKNSTMTMERIQLLNKIGFHWSYKSYASSNSA